MEFEELFLPPHIFERLNKLSVRTINARHLGPLLRDPKDPKRYLCRWCHGTVPKGSRTWCSSRCVSSFQAISIPANIEAHILKRDGNYCQLCGVNVLEYQAELNRLQGLVVEASNLSRGYKIRKDGGFDKYQEDAERLEQLDQIIAAAAEKDPFLWTHSRRYRNCSYSRGAMTSLRKLERPELKKLHAYEIDHILPLSLGGSSLPHNLVVLCIHCHRVKTAKDAADLAKRRRLEKRHQGSAL